MLVWCSRATVSASRLKPLHGLFVGDGAEPQHLQGHVAAERGLLGLVDDAHAAAAELADDPELAQGRRRLGRRAGRAVDELDAGQAGLELRGQLGMSRAEAAGDPGPGPPGGRPCSGPGCSPAPLESRAVARPAIRRGRWSEAGPRSCRARPSAVISLTGFTEAVRGDPPMIIGPEPARCHAKSRRTVCTPSFASFTGAVNRYNSHIVYIDVLNEVSVMPARGAQSC